MGTLPDDEDVCGRFPHVDGVVRFMGCKFVAFETKGSKQSSSAWLLAPPRGRSCLASASRTQRLGLARIECAYDDSYARSRRLQGRASRKTILHLERPSSGNPRRGKGEGEVGSKGVCIVGEKWAGASLATVKLCRSAVKNRYRCFRSQRWPGSLSFWPLVVWRKRITVYL